MRCKNLVDQFGGLTATVTVLSFKLLIGLPSFLLLILSYLLIASLLRNSRNLTHIRNPLIYLLSPYA